MHQAKNETFGPGGNAKVDSNVVLWLVGKWYINADL